MLWVLQHFPRHSQFHDLAKIHDGYMISELGHGGDVVTDQNETEMERVLQFQDEIDDRVAHDRVDDFSLSKEPGEG